MSCLATFGVWPRTLPARASEPWTLPVEEEFLSARRLERKKKISEMKERRRKVAIALSSSRRWDDGEKAGVFRQLEAPLRGSLALTARRAIRGLRATSRGRSECGPEESDGKGGKRDARDAARCRPGQLRRRRRCRRRRSNVSLPDCSLRQGPIVRGSQRAEQNRHARAACTESERGCSSSKKHGSKESSIATTTTAARDRRRRQKTLKKSGEFSSTSLSYRRG